MILVALAFFLLAGVYVACAFEQARKDEHGNTIACLIAAVGFSILGVWQCTLL